jgi:cytochrome bd-type quinol oxidase subunit 2
VAGSAWLAALRREGWAFAGTTVAVAACVVSVFTELYPRVTVSSTSPAYSLTIGGTAAGGYSLRVMTVVVIVFLPLVLLYQGWTYYVFRQRVSQDAFRPAAAEISRDHAIRREHGAGRG